MKKCINFFILLKICYMIDYVIEVNYIVNIFKYLEISSDF